MLTDANGFLSVCFAARIVIAVHIIATDEYDSQNFSDFFAIQELITNN